MKIQIDLQGVSPLLMHNVRLADPQDEITRAMKRISAKKSKMTDEEQLELARLEFLDGLYFAEDIGPYLRGAAVKGSFKRGAIRAKTRKGADVGSGLLMFEENVQLQYDGPRSADDLWNDANFRDRQSVKIGQNRVMRVRPRFNQWALSTTADLDTQVMNFDDFEEIAVISGRVAGLGDFRPEKGGSYGRYDARITIL